MKPTAAILGVIVALAAVALLAARYWPAPQPESSASIAAPAKPGVPDAAQLTRFETMAVSACQCARGKDEARIGACWAEFDKSTAPFAPSSVVSMCMDSSESLCFGMGDGIVTDEVAKRIKCISVNRSGSGVCTAAEERAAAAKASGGDC